LMPPSAAGVANQQSLTFAIVSRAAASNRSTSVGWGILVPPSVISPGTTLSIIDFLV
jgi:hypothetical protein